MKVEILPLFRDVLLVCEEEMEMERVIKKFKAYGQKTQLPPSKGLS